MVGEYNELNNKFIYTGPSNRYFIYILYTKSHYNVILSMKALLDTNRFCNYCKTGYDHDIKHSCKHTCKCCKRQDCIENVLNIKCSRCKEKAMGMECLRVHQEKICKKRILCNFCNNVFIKNQHGCHNQKFCLHC